MFKQTVDMRCFYCLLFKCAVDTCIFTQICIFTRVAMVRKVFEVTL